MTGSIDKETINDFLYLSRRKCALQAIKKNRSRNWLRRLSNKSVQTQHVHQSFIWKKPRKLVEQVKLLRCY